MMGMAQITKEYDETTEQFCSLLVFQLAGQAFALNIESVTQIIPMLRLTPVPQVENTIEGVANIHGKIVPVISARRHLGLPYVEPGLYTPIILTRVGERQVGWIVDEVNDVINVPTTGITSPRDILPESQEQTQVMSGLVYQQGQSILVLDPRYFLRPSQFRTINRAVHTNARAAELLRPPLDGDDSDDFQLTTASRQSVFDAVRAAAAEKAVERLPGNGNGNGNGNGKPVSTLSVEPPAQAMPTAPATAPVAVPTAAPSAAPSAIEKPTVSAAAKAPAPETPPAQTPEPPAEPAAKKPKASKRGSQKGKVIPNTGSQPAVQPRAGQRKIQAVLDEQFSALASDILETEPKPFQA